MKKKKAKAKSSGPSLDETEVKDFKKLVAKLKKEKSKKELLAIVAKQPENHELVDFLAAREVLDELGVKYSKSFE